MTDRKTYKWTGTDDAQRADAATIAFEADRLQAVGSSTTPDYALSWHLTAGAEWITQEHTSVCARIRLGPEPQTFPR